MDSFNALKLDMKGGVNMNKYFLLILLFTSSVYSAEPSQLLKCSAIKDGVNRLACFDDLAKTEQKNADNHATKNLSSNESKSNNWNLSISQSKIDDSETVVLMTDAKEPVPGRFKQKAIPTLVVRCLEKTTSSYINFDGLFMSDNAGHGKVTFRIDKDKPFTQNLTVSNDHKALGLWNGNLAIPFIKRLMAGEALIVQATPYSETSVMLTFDISKLEKEIEPLRKACKW